MIAFLFSNRMRLVVLGLVALALPWGAVTAMNMPGSHAAGATAESFPYGHPGLARQVSRVIHIEALDIRFEPQHISVRRGETVRFVIHNASKVAHEFVIGDAALQAQHEKEMQAMPSMSMEHDVNGVSLPPGQTRELVWTFTRDGTVEYACHVPGHFAAGMLGKIRIESPSHRG